MPKLVDEGSPDRFRVYHEDTSELDALHIGCGEDDGAVPKVYASHSIEVLNVVRDRLRALTLLVDRELNTNKSYVAQDVLARDQNGIARLASDVAPDAPAKADTWWSACEAPKVGFERESTAACSVLSNMGSLSTPATRGSHNESSQSKTECASYNKEDQALRPCVSFEVVDETQQRFSAQFERLDVDGKGVLSIRDCEDFLLRCKVHMTHHDIAMMLNFLGELASNGLQQSEALLTYEGFVYLMSHPMGDEHGEIGRNLEALKQAFTEEGQQRRSKRRSFASAMHVPTDPQAPYNKMLVVCLDTIPGLVIMLNALVIGVETDLGNKDESFWEVCEAFFATFFTCELMAKLYLYGCQTFWITGEDVYWNYFDVLCVATALLDLAFTYGAHLFVGDDAKIDGGSGFMLIKMLRLARLVRLVRLLRFKIFDELKLMIQGVACGARVLLWAMVLLFMIIFVLAIVTRKTVGDDMVEFGTLIAAMFTWFRCFTGDCSTYTGRPLQLEIRAAEYGVICVLAYATIILFVTIGLFNLIMAIFVENVVTAQVKRKQAHLGENAAAMQLKICEVIARRVAEMDMRGTHLSVKLRRALETISTGKLKTPTATNITARQRRADMFLTSFDEEGRAVSRDAFLDWLHHPEVIQVLEESEIETSTKHELFDALDVDSGGELTVDELIIGIMKLRGPISKTDIVATRLKVEYMTELVEDICRKLNIELTCDRERITMESQSPSQQDLIKRISSRRPTGDRRTDSRIS